MKRKLLLILLGILLLIIQGGVLAQDDYLIALNTNGITYLQNGEKCTVTLDEQAFPQDFTWHYQFSDFSKLYKHEETQSKAQRTFVFKAIEPGEVRIIFEIYNPKLGKSSTKQKKEFLLIIRNKGEAEFTGNTVVIPADVHNQDLVSDRPISKPITSSYYDETLKTEKPVSKAVVIKPSVSPPSASVAKTPPSAPKEELTYQRTVTPGKPAVSTHESQTETKIEVSKPVKVNPPQKTEQPTPQNKPTKATTSSSFEVAEGGTSSKNATQIRPPVKNSGNPPAPNQRNLTPLNTSANSERPSYEPEKETITETKEEIANKTAEKPAKKPRKEKAPKAEKNKEKSIAIKAPKASSKTNKSETSEEESESKSQKRMITPKSSGSNAKENSKDSPIRPVNPLHKNEQEIDKFSDEKALNAPEKPQRKPTKTVSGQAAYSSFHNGAKTLSVNRLNVVSSGEDFCIDFNNNMPTDCSWVFDFNTHHFTYTDDQIIKGSSIAPGTPDIHSFRFKANQSGTFTLVFRLFNPNDPTISQSVSYEIMIR